ncbi:HAMP domain-containing sensor histidine kinase [Desulfosporosinus sp. FKA]|uniref:sensor histidine kinase n=1 Tax=Desulfosporosinus sp. FKA TaxID=1969834 RepID=UPI000B49C917|nr:HAMP domain-containing sensor histidine kinase [Desulfosporosinus sp. FKA]
MKYSIQLKILLYLSIILLIGFSLLTFAVYNTTWQNSQRIIKGDMIAAKKNLDLYLSQYRLVSNMDLSAATLPSEAENISRQLSTQIGSNVDIYSLQGEKLSYGSAPADDLDKTEDLAKAMKGEIAYTTNFRANQVMVSLSYPIGRPAVGILRYFKDYTQLYGDNQKFMDMICLFAAIIFFVIFIASYIFSTQITKPIKKLAKAAEEVSQGNYDLKLNIHLNDEIGYLASRFQLMMAKIREQIEIIQQDRDVLEQVQKENKKFFDNVTHELKTPITTIAGYAQAIEDLGIKEDEFTRKGLQSIINESSRLNHMVIELIELSKASSNKFSYEFTDLNLSELIEETSDEMMIKAKKYNIVLNCSIEQDLRLKGDRDRLKEVLINLIDNAIKYGNVNSVIQINACREKNVVWVGIKDQGPGIPEELRQKVFDPFFRVSEKTSRELGSTGLGLTIVKEIMEKHKGCIDIKSIPGEGTEVILRFESGVL